MSISNADSAGNLRIVGSAATANGGGAALATFNVRTGAAHAVFFNTYAGATLYGVNENGEAVGTAAYDPAGGFVSPAVFVAPAGKPLEVAQPQCTKTARYCAVIYPFIDGAPCPFGGCFVNNVGTILAVDALTNTLMTFTYGERQEPRDLPLAATQAGFWQLNDVGQILYGGTAALPGAYVYSSANDTLTSIPVPSSCAGGASNFPVAINNLGEVLGFAECGTSTRYWTWTARGGLHDLAAAIPVNPAYSLILPLAVNDRGQILVTLYTVSGARHWGLLDPPSRRPTSRRIGRGASLEIT